MTTIDDISHYFKATVDADIQCVSMFLHHDSTEVQYSASPNNLFSVYANYVRKIE